MKEWGFFRLHWALETLEIISNKTKVVPRKEYLPDPRIVGIMNLLCLAKPRSGSISEWNWDLGSGHCFGDVPCLPSVLQKD